MGDGPLDMKAWEIGRQVASRASFHKQADTPTTVHKLGGRLYLSRNGWLLLKVPNALLQGAFDALHAPGAELPAKPDGALNAHISVMRPEEVAKIGENKLTERGHTFYYTLGPIKEITPLSWDDVSKVWVIEVDSPDLKDLRKSYGLSPLPHDDHQFHITIGIRRKNVLRDNAVAKFDVDQTRTNDANPLAPKAASVATRCESVLDIDWQDVPALITERLLTVIPLVKAARHELIANRETTAEALLVYSPVEKQAYLSGVSKQVANEAGFTWLPALPNNTDDLVCVKLASGFGDAWRGANTAIGGPNALTNTITGGLAGGALGYLGGAVAESMFPERYLERGKLRKTLGLAGAGLGAMPGLWLAAAKYQNAVNANKLHPVVDALTEPLQPAAAFTAGGLVEGLADWEPNFNNLKFANNNAGGYVKGIPVDAFNRAVWNDVRSGSASQNRFGTQSPWGEASDKMHTPPALAAATTGLVSGISAMHDNASILHPSTMIHGIVQAGSNLTTANIAGRTLSALAGLTPHAQRQLQDSGVWAGVLSAVIPPIFGY